MKVVADRKALNMFHTDIAWHAKVAISLPSGNATGVVDIMGFLGMGKTKSPTGSWHRRHRGWSSSAPTAFGDNFLNLQLAWTLG
ncbi:Hypothetical protein FKW44_014002, partial [Caligus rogercresseyi]